MYRNAFKRKPWAIQVAFGTQVGSRRALGMSRGGGGARTGAYSATWAPLGGFRMSFLPILDFEGVPKVTPFSEVQEGASTKTWFVDGFLNPKGETVRGNKRNVRLIFVASGKV